MNDLLLQADTSRQIEVYVAAPSHAVLLFGASGSGKKHLSRKLAENVLGIADFDGYPYGLVISPSDGKAIGIEAIRRVNQFLGLKVPGQAIYNRVIIIQDAHGLTLEAQNALLKTLEEPPSGTLLLLTASHKQSLLPTILSRTQQISINQPDLNDTEAYFTAQGFDHQKIGQAYAVSGGLIGLMNSLLKQIDHPLVKATAKARQLLSQTAYERLTAVDELSKQKHLAADTLFILQQMAHVSLRKGSQSKRWQSILQISYETEEALKLNAQPKLALSKLMLNM